MIWSTVTGAKCSILNEADNIQFGSSATGCASGDDFRFAPGPFLENPNPLRRARRRNQVFSFISYFAPASPTTENPSRS